MTLIVGIRCQDGVVMASDSAATFGTGASPTIGQQNITKIRKIKGAMLYASTGAVGMSQVVAQRLESGYANGEYKSKGPAAAMTVMGKAIAQEVHPFLQSANLVRPLVGDASGSLCKSMLAMTISGEVCLFTFDYNGAPEQATEDLPFVAMGSGQPIADPFLAYLKKLFWSETAPTLAEGRLVAAWVIDHATRTNPGGVGGPTQLAQISGGKVEQLDIEHIQEHLEKITLAEERLVQTIRGEASSPGTSPPPEASTPKAKG